MKRPPGVHWPLYGETQLAAVIDEMAAQLAPQLQHSKRLAVIGILRRGAPLADRLCAALAPYPGIAPPLRLDLALKRYADDLTLLHPETRLTEDPGLAAADLAGYTMLVVDDVLYTGHSLLKAVNHLVGKRPERILVATLGDRCVCRLPVHADVVGLRLQVAPGDVVDCHVPPYETEFAIELLRPDRRS